MDGRLAEALSHAHRGLVDERRRLRALVADALRADPPPTDEDRAAFDHFRRTGEVLGAAPPAAAEE